MAQDDWSNPGTPFAVGLTLESLSAHTVDEAGREAFVTQDPLKLLRKARGAAASHCSGPGLPQCSAQSLAACRVLHGRMPFGCRECCAAWRVARAIQRFCASRSVHVMQLQRRARRLLISGGLWAHGAPRIPPTARPALRAQAAQLRRLALYFDVGAELWRPRAAWGDMSLPDWDGLFQPGIAEGGAASPRLPVRGGEGPSAALAAAEESPGRGRAEETRPARQANGGAQARTPAAP